MDFMKVFAVIAEVMGAIKDGKIDEEEVGGILEKILLMVASIKGKPLSEAIAMEMADMLVALYKLFA